MKELQNKLGIIFFLIIVSLLVMNIALNAEEKRIVKEKSFNVNQGETITIETSGADVKIKSWDKNEVYVKILGSKRAEERINFVIEKSGTEVRVISKRKMNSFFNFWGGLNLRIEAFTPKNFNVNVETSGGDVNADDLNGKFKLTSSGGDIKLNGLTGELILKTSGGDIELVNTSGNLDAATSGGNIVCKNVAGKISVNTSGGDINIQAKEGEIDAVTSGGDIKISLENNFNGIKAKTSGGDIALELP
ncbi:MAG: DUF4097 family beta strand repeat-containing protein, partial [Melioribacter sp.]|nr:DUF4097 family beta strand repeat-containing protein [Melioribacter sp.]